MSEDLAAFLRARLGEDEQWAQLTRSSWDQPEWRADHNDVFARGGPRIAETRSANVAPHIARHDPARVLREVAAGRAIIELHDRAHECSVFNHGDVDPGTWVTESEDCSTLRALAAVYADHPDYRQEWRT